MSQPEHKVDFLKIKLAVDEQILGSSQSEVNSTIDHMVVAIGAMIPPDASSVKKLETIKKFLYQSGPWNDHNPFQYDFDDPQGTEIRNKILQRYLETRKGNCVSMPILLLILADRIGLDVSLSVAPLHVLVKFTVPESGRTYNVEATSGGSFARDEWYIQKMGITPTALKNGIYLSRLSRTETAALITTTLGSDLFQKRKLKKAAEIFELILKYYPNSVHAMLKAGSIYSDLISEEFASRYQSPNDIPFAERASFETYLTKNKHYFDKAISLGWRRPESREERRYLNEIRHQKNKG